LCTVSGLKRERDEKERERERERGLVSGMPCCSSRHREREEKEGEREEKEREREEREGSLVVCHAVLQDTITPPGPLSDIHSMSAYRRNTTAPNTPKKKY
jgi:hypothetical protein